MRHVSRPTALGLAVLALSVAACGGDDAKPAAATSTGATTTSSTGGGGAGGSGGAGQGGSGGQGTSSAGGSGQGGSGGSGQGGSGQGGSGQGGSGQGGSGGQGGSAPLPDPTAPGPLATTFADYEFAAAVDPEVLSDRATELRARIYMPATLSDAPYPVVLTMPGNTITCGATPQIIDENGDCAYTTTGACSGAYPVVLQNWLGYGYLADRLASWGYVVVAIDTNRGIACGAGVAGDPGLNLARGRVYLKHLELLGKWATNQGTTPASVGVDLFGKLDLGHVGLFGHSRSGEGSRAAVQLYRDPNSPWPAAIPVPVGFEAIFEVGGNDGQTSRVLDALGLHWHQMYPACDGPNYDFSGIKPFDRMLGKAGDVPQRMKSYSVVWGANHRGYNENWLASDALGCAGTYWTEPQLWQGLGPWPAIQTNGLQLAVRFFRGAVPASVPGTYDPTLLDVFDPARPLDASILAVANVNRGYVPSANPQASTSLDDFTQQSASSAGVTLTWGGVPDHQPTLAAAKVTWTQAGANTYFQSNWAPAGSGVDLSQDRAIDLRIARAADPLNGKDVPTDATLQLVAADGSLSSAVKLSTYTTLGGPTGSVYLANNVPATHYHETLRTVSLPTCDFTGIDLGSVRGLRLTFDATPTGAVYLSGIRKRVGGAGGCVPTPVPQPGQMSPGIDVALPAPLALADRAARVVLAGSGPAGAEVTVESDARFPVSDALYELDLGGSVVRVSRYPDPTDLRRLTFSLSDEEAARLSTGGPVAVRLGDADGPHVTWRLVRSGREGTR